MVDGRGRRIGKKVNGVFTRKWLYEGQLRIVAEQQLDSSGNVTAVDRFVYGANSNTLTGISEAGARPARS